MNDHQPSVYCTFHDAPGHQFSGHPESPNRLGGLSHWVDNPPYPEIHWLDFTPAVEGDVTLVHRKATLTFLKEESQKGAHEFEPSPSYVTEQSYLAALGAVGATLSVSRQIISQTEGRGFAIVRPPGHHAEPDASMGFCLLNNIAVAAADAVASGLSKVAIVDFDAHHGNGIEAAFWNTPEVGYFSTHETDIYPGTGHQQSAPHARGRIINVPLPAFSGNASLLSIYEQVAGPWLSNFGAEMLFVSAGFDGHFSDPLTTLTLDTNGYYQLTQTLVRLAEAYCHGRMMFVLEGGYDPIALKDNIQACLAALSGHRAYNDSYGSGPNLRIESASLIEKMKSLHQLEER